MRRDAFTLLELLLTAALIATLAALLLPAIQAGRERARGVQCSHQLRQVALALLAHHDAARAFPSGGWGHRWIGMAGRGSGRDQPGSWFYSILPQVEQAPLASLAPGDAQFLLGTPQPLLTCPSRRECRTWPISDQFEYVRTPLPRGSAVEVSRSDYAINGGASGVMGFEGPASLEEGESPIFSWPMSSSFMQSPSVSFTGISHIRRSVRLTAVQDGTSATYLAGEKYLDIDRYADGEDLGDNESLYNGYCTDNHRFARIDLVPMSDGRGRTNATDYMRFGSAHEAGLFMGYCDGSVRFLDFTVDALVHYRSGHVADQGGFPPSLP